MTLIGLTLVAVLTVSASLCTEKVHKRGQHTDAIRHEKEKYGAGQNMALENMGLLTSRQLEQLLDEYEDGDDPSVSPQWHFEHQIRADLAKYATAGISRAQVEAGAETAGATLYQVLNGSVYRKAAECMFPARCEGVQYILARACHRLPDTEMAVNTHDWPMLHSRTQQIPRAAVFSFSKIFDKHDDILFPTWSFWKGGPAIDRVYPSGIGRWDLQREIIMRSARENPWDSKQAVAFFRGSRTNSDRDSLVLFARDNPELADAQYTKNQAWRSSADTIHMPPAKAITFEENCKYKYLVNYEGVAASFRLRHLFLCGSAVIHVTGTNHTEFFYGALRPWVHYIPVPERQPSSVHLSALLHFLRENDALVRRVAANGYRLVREHLRMEDVVRYQGRVLAQYTEHLTYTPVLRDDMVRVAECHSS